MRAILERLLPTTGPGGHAQVRHRGWDEGLTHRMVQSSELRYTFRVLIAE